jgi:hypothetical protein
MPNILDIVVVELLMLPKCLFDGDELRVHGSIWYIHESEKHDLDVSNESWSGLALRAGVLYIRDLDRHVLGTGRVCTTHICRSSQPSLFHLYPWSSGCSRQLMLGSAATGAERHVRCIEQFGIVGM